MIYGRVYPQQTVNYQLRISSGSRIPWRRQPETIAEQNKPRCRLSTHDSIRIWFLYILQPIKLTKAVIICGNRYWVLWRGSFSLHSYHVITFAEGRLAYKKCNDKDRGIVSVPINQRNDIYQIYQAVSSNQWSSSFFSFRPTSIRNHLWSPRKCSHNLTDH